MCITKPFVELTMGDTLSHTETKPSLNHCYLSYLLLFIEFDSAKVLSFFYTTMTGFTEQLRYNKVCHNLDISSSAVCSVITLTENLRLPRSLREAPK